MFVLACEVTVITFIHFFFLTFTVSAYTELESAKAEEVEKLNDSVREKGLL